MLFGCCEVRPKVLISCMGEFIFSIESLCYESLFLSDVTFSMRLVLSYYVVYASVVS